MGCNLGCPILRFELLRLFCICNLHMFLEEHAMAQPRPMEPTPPREAKLFRNNKSQAVRIPADFELTGDRVLVRREADP